MSVRSTGWILSGALLAMLLMPQPAAGLPAFARRYKVSCQLCHNPIPKLTDFGEQFAANGYRMSPTEDVGDTISTGDDLLTLFKEVPLAVRLDLYAQGFADGKASADFETPTAIKLLSSGAITRKISYFLYTLLLENGENAGVEDAFVYFNDLGGKPIDLAVGQFQVSDPLFKRELRLEFQDYAVYGTHVGSVPSDLTYDRGLLASVDVAGFNLTTQLLNGDGIGPAHDNGRFDGDRGKSLAVRLTREIVGPLRLGGFWYTGRTSDTLTTNTTTYLGGDGTLTLGPLEINGQYLHRSDNRPTYTPGERKATMDGGFVEAILRPKGSRFYGFALYNRLTANRPLLDVGLGGPSPTDRYQSIAAGMGHLIRRNFRVGAELGYDLESEDTRLTVGGVLAF